MGDMIFRWKTFNSFGLNKYRNFLRKEIYELEEYDDIFVLTNELLNLNGCLEGAVFLLDLNNNMYCCYAISEEEAICMAEIDDIDFDGDELYMAVLQFQDFDYDNFADLDADMRFCCYSLLIETQPNKWEVIVA